MSEPKTLTPEQISGLKELAGKATPGPWYQESWKQPKPPCEGATELSRLLCCFADEPAPRFWNWHTDGEFVASSREAVPALIEMVEGLTGEVERWKEIARTRRNKKDKAIHARNEHRDGLLHWQDRATSAERRAGELEAALKAFRSLVREGGVPRYTVTPGAALNSVIEEVVDPALRRAASEQAS